MTILKFYADWCQPCKRLDPIFEQIENDYDVEVNHLNIEDKLNVALMQEHSIRSVPTVVFLDDDNVVIESVHGAQPKQQYINIIEDNQ